MSTALAPLRLPGFPNLSLAYLVNELGNWLGEIALAILVFDQTGSPLATAALFCGMHFAPALLGPPLVARLEALPIRISLPSLYAIEAGVFALLALISSDFALVWVLLLATVDGSIASAARALTRAAATAVLAPSGRLREGNALLNVAFTVGAAGGPALAGVVVAGAGVETALLADAVSFMAVAVLLAVASRLALPEPEEPEAGWGERMRAGLAYVRERTTLRRLLAAQALAFIFFSLVIPIEVVFAKRTLDAGDAGYGALLASWGAGMVFGSVAFAALRRAPLPAQLLVSTLAIGAAYLGTAVSPTLAVACAASFVGGLGNGVQWIALVTAVQELTRAAYQARVLSLLESLASAMPGIGFLAGGAIAAIFSPRASYAVAGAGVFAVAALAALALRRTDWEPELQQGGDDETPASQEDDRAQRRLATLLAALEDDEGEQAAAAQGSLPSLPAREDRRGARQSTEAPPDQAPPPGGRAVAIRLAAAGATRAEVESHLRANFEPYDPAAVLDEVFGPYADAASRVPWAAPASGRVGPGDSSPNLAPSTPADSPGPPPPVG